MDINYYITGPHNKSDNGPKSMWQIEFGIGFKLGSFFEHLDGFENGDEKRDKHILDFDCNLSMKSVK